MIVEVLCEDTAQKAPFLCEHGLSLLIRTEKHLVLFDAGQTDVFIENAAMLDVDLADVDIAVLSHGHYDHGGGLLAFFEKNTKAKVYLHKEAFGEFYQEDRYIGLSDVLWNYSDRLEFVEEEIIIDDELTILTASPYPTLTSAKLCERIDGLDLPDAFFHEIYLLVNHGGQNALFTGCAHRGILSITREAAKYGVTHIVGGFHLQNDLPKETMRTLADDLSAFPFQYYTGHCTESVAYSILERTLHNRLHRISAGMRFVIGSHAELACYLFRLGYNCSQAVFGAFAEEFGVDSELALRISCSFGGGMGRLREVCGAVSGMLLVCGMSNGYSTPETGTIKASHYKLVQRLANAFREMHGSIICRDLLGGTASAEPIPSERTPEYYSTRPCERLIGTAAKIIEENIFNDI